MISDVLYHQKKILLLKYSKSEKICFISKGDTFQTIIWRRVKTDSVDYSLEMVPLANVTFDIVHLTKWFHERLKYLVVMERPASENFA